MRSTRLIGWVARHRVAVTLVLLLVNASPAVAFDDRQLLKTNSGAFTNVLVILDSSTSMLNDFGDRFRLPAYMDDFLYPQGTFQVEGSKFAVAKSALREVIGATRGVNWAFSYYRNPDQRYGAAWRTAGAPSSGTPDNGAIRTGDKLRNGGMEFLYIACDSSTIPAQTACTTSPSTTDFNNPTKYPDIQPGRYLQLGHKVMHNYELENGDQLPNGTFTGSRLQADNRDPYTNLTDQVGTPRVGDPVPGVWRGAFGPYGDATMVIYRNSKNPLGCNPSNADAGPDGILGTADDVIPTTNPCNELRMTVINRNFPSSGFLSDTGIDVQVTEYGPPTATPTPIPATATPTPTQTFTRTSTNTPTITNTPLPPTATFTRTATATITDTPIPPTSTRTATRTSTATSTRTQTRTNTPTPTVTGTPPTATVTRTFTNTFTRTNTLTPAPPTNTFTRTNTFTPVPPTNTFTVTNTPTITNTPAPPTNTRTQTPTKTITNTPVPPTKTFTPTSTSTPTPTPTDQPQGMKPAESRLPLVANWLSAAMRGVLAMAPPPPPPPPPSSTVPCVGNSGIPSTYDPSSNLKCGPCSNPSYQPGWICAFADANANGVDDGAFGGESRPLPAVNRGFDDPQADPNPSFVPTGRSAVIHYIRADLVDLGADRNGGGNQTAGSGYVGNANAASPPCPSTSCADNGNPPWGSGSPDSSGVMQDVDADGVLDTSAILNPGVNRHNQGMYGAHFEQAWRQNSQEFPMDAAAARSSCFGAPDPCNPYSADCGGMAHFYDSTGTTFLNAPDKPDGSGSTFVPYTTLVPPSKQDWPAVPFQRGDWTNNNPNDAPNVPVIKRLMRMVSSLVAFDPDESHGALNAYSLAENANNVVMPAPGTPIAGVLLDAYKYFKNTVFPDAMPVSAGGHGDPAASCRRYLIVFITDGIDECNSGPPDAAHPTRVNRSCSGPGVETIVTSGDPSLGDNTADGVAGDLGRIKLPEINVGDRAAAHASNPQIQTNGVPVYMVSLGGTPSVFNCIADKSDPQESTAVADTHVLGATDRAGLVSALNSILTFVNVPRFFAAPSVPAFATGSSAVSEIGAVIPSHVNEDGSSSAWSIWAGSLKAYKLDAVGQIPTVTPTGTPPPTPTPGGAPTPNFPDEGTPDDSSILTRRPVWNAARVLGYTNPATQLVPNSGAGAPAALPSTKPGPIQVWPGRHMIWAKPGSPIVPMSQQPFVPDNGSGSPDPALITAMNLNPSSTPDVLLAEQTIEFLRGGATNNSTGSSAPGPTPTPAGIGGPPGSRDEILNQLPGYTSAGAIGPGFQNQYSYWFWDDAPPPGQPRPDGTSPLSTPTPGPTITPGGPTPNPTPAGEVDGYPHKLGDIFHSDVVTLEPPKYFQYLVNNPNNYLGFATTNQFRRKVVFAGSNDGFLHAFDGGVYNRDSALPNDFDLGTGREVFAYAPASGPASVQKFAKFPPLLNFPPQPNYFADGALNHTDAFVDPSNNGAPVAANRQWRTLLVGGERQGGHYYYALDVTQPDILVASGPTQYQKSAPMHNAPDCLLPASGTVAAGCVDAYPQVRWEFTDNPATPTITNPALGETWSRPVLGRIHIHNAGNGSDTDRYVAIFGGGYDANYTPGAALTATTQGRAIYVVNLETGLTLAKLTTADCLGAACSTTPINIAPVAAGVAAADYDDDGYLDVAYVGDMNGHMLRLDLALGGTGATCTSCGLAAEKLTGLQPFVLFDASQNSNLAIPPATTHTEPIFQEAGLIFLQGGAPPKLGIAFGTGFRPDLIAANDSHQRFYLVDDRGAGNTTSTLVETDLKDLTPPGPNTNTGALGFYLNFEDSNEKTTSTVFSTLGQLSLITFTKNSGDPCTTEGESFTYRFLYANGQGGYQAGTNVDYGSSSTGYYRLQLGGGLVSGSQNTTEQGILDTNLFTGGAIGQTPSAGGIRTINQNWKEISQ